MKTTFPRPSMQNFSLTQVSDGEFLSDSSLDQISCPDSEFAAMLDAFRSTGGLARRTELAQQLRGAGIFSSQDFVRSAVKGRLVCFEWSQSTWLPLFQFEPNGGSILQGLGPVIASLRPLLSPWKMAQWFAEPNPWLDERLPAEVLAINSTAVLKAACAERFLIAC